MDGTIPREAVFETEKQTFDEKNLLILSNRQM